MRNEDAYVVTNTAFPGDGKNQSAVDEDCNSDDDDDDDDANCGSHNHVKAPSLLPRTVSTSFNRSLVISS